MFLTQRARTVRVLCISIGLSAACLAFCFDARLLYLEISHGEGNPRKLIPTAGSSAGRSSADTNEIIRRALESEMAGDVGKAERVLSEAAQVDTGFVPRFALAGFYYRQRDRKSFAKWGRAALESGDDGAQPILGMAEQLGMRDDEIVTIVPDKANVVAAALQRAITKVSVKEVLEFSNQLLRAGGPEQSGQLLSACEALLWMGQVTEAVNRWNAGIRQGWLKSDLLSPQDGISLTDSTFSPEAPSHGFGWMVDRLDDHSSIHRSHGLSVELSGEQADGVRLAAQYLPVQPGRRYFATFSYEVGQMSLPGVFWRIIDLRTNKEIAHSPDLVANAKSAVAVFDVPRDTSVVGLALWARRRPGSSRPSGSFTVVKVDLVRLVSQ